MKYCAQFSAWLGTLLLACPAWAGIVIDKTFCQAPHDFEGLQWIGLHNSDAEAVDTSGWRLTRGVEFRLPAKLVPPPGGFMVLGKDAILFVEFYALKLGGEFKKSLGRGGDTLEIIDAGGQVVDRVKFGDCDPWLAAQATLGEAPRVPDGPGGTGEAVEVSWPGPCSPLVDME